MIKDTLTYDIVGSFLRPAEIKEARKAYKDGKITKEELTQAEDLAIASLVEKEVAHGLKYVTDGEFRRRWWHLDWLKEFDGFDTIHFTKESMEPVMKLSLEPLPVSSSMIRTRHIRSFVRGTIFIL